MFVLFCVSKLVSNMEYIVQFEFKSPNFKCLMKTISEGKGYIGI